MDEAPAGEVGHSLCHVPRQLELDRFRQDGNARCALREQEVAKSAVFAQLADEEEGQPGSADAVEGNDIFVAELCLHRGLAEERVARVTGRIVPKTLDRDWDADVALLLRRCWSDTRCVQETLADDGKGAAAEDLAQLDSTAAQLARDNLDLCAGERGCQGVLGWASQLIIKIKTQEIITIIITCSPAPESRPSCLICARMAAKLWGRSRNARL